MVFESFRRFQRDFEIFYDFIYFSLIFQCSFIDHHKYMSLVIFSRDFSVITNNDQIIKLQIV